MDFNFLYEVVFGNKLNSLLINGSWFELILPNLEWIYYLYYSLIEGKAMGYGKSSCFNNYDLLVV